MGFWMVLDLYLFKTVVFPGSIKVHYLSSRMIPDSNHEVKIFLFTVSLDGAFEELDLVLLCVENITIASNEPSLTKRISINNRIYC